MYEYYCPKCNGIAYNADCEMCNGTGVDGRTESIKDCPKCEGTGAQDSILECSECGYEFDESKVVE